MEKRKTSASELNLTYSPASLISAVVAGVPESVFRISEALKQNGLEKICFDDPSAHSEFIALRNALDTGKPKNLFEACKSAFSMYDTFLTLITSFKESIIPPALQMECLRAASDINSCWSCVEKFPVENRNMFIYFIGFVSELVKWNSTANSQMQLIADIIFKRPTGDGGCLQRLKFLETCVSGSREVSKNAPSISIHYQHDADLIVL